MSVGDPDDEFDDDDLDPGLPPHPLDRTWFHPSEVGAAISAWRSGGVIKRRDWGLTAVVGALSVVVTVVVLALAGAFDSGSSTGGPSVATGLLGAPSVRAWSDAIAAANPAVVAVVSGASTGGPGGSGVVVDGSHVLTSATVLGAAATATVVSANGKQAAAHVVGTDPETDLTLLQVDGGGLAPARVGNSDDVRIGDSVLALGRDSSNQPAPVEGIVGGLRRVTPLPGGGVVAGLIATDIADGKSAAGNVYGGALLDTNGSVVGILSAEVPGQAVPINLATEQVAQQLAASGRASHGWLGVAAVTNWPAGGAKLTVVTAGSPAAQAGLQAGDVITQMTYGTSSADRVTSVDDLVASVEEHVPGDDATVTAWRNGRQVTMRSVPLELRPSPAPTMYGLAG